MTCIKSEKETQEKLIELEIEGGVLYYMYTNHATIGLHYTVTFVFSQLHF